MGSTCQFPRCEHPTAANFKLPSFLAVECGWQGLGRPVRMALIPGFEGWNVACERHAESPWLAHWTQPCRRPTGRAG